MSRGFTSSYRISLLAALTFLAFAGLGVRLVFLHVIDRSARLAELEKAREKVTPRVARRGDILDRKFATLATSEQWWTLGVDPQSVTPQDKTKIPELAQLLGLPVDKVSLLFTTKTRLPRPKTPVATPAQADGALAFKFGTPADDNADDDDEVGDDGLVKIRYSKLGKVTDSVYEQVAKLQIKALVPEATYHRVYPQGSLAAHVVGYVTHSDKGDGDVPATAIEKYADFFLRGENGWVETEKDGRQREMAQFRKREMPAKDGYSVVLTIDSVIQNIVEDELRWIATNLDPKKATIIVSDPKTGYILALANYPTFNLNDTAKVAKDNIGVLNNPAVADVYDPGSVFKIVAVSAGLDQGIVSPQTTFDCSPSMLEAMAKDGKEYPLPKEDISDHFGRLSVAEVLKHSSNKGTAQIALEEGRESFYGYIRRFGFHQRTGLPPLGGEQPGFLSPPEKWGQKDFTRIPIGQSISVTPMQMHEGMSVIASGGRLLYPILIREVRDAQGETVSFFGPRLHEVDNDHGQAITPQTARLMAVMLEGVASKGGTAPEAEIPGYQVAGKTATAQKLVDGHYSTTEHVGSFIGFFPATNPQIEISVIVDDADHKVPGHIAYGHLVAAPSFKRIAQKLISYLQIQPPAAENTGAMLAMGGIHP